MAVEDKRTPLHWSFVAKIRLFDLITLKLVIHEWTLILRVILHCYFSRSKKRICVEPSFFLCIRLTYTHTHTRIFVFLCVVCACKYVYANCKQERKVLKWEAGNSSLVVSYTVCQPTFIQDEYLYTATYAFV